MTTARPTLGAFVLLGGIVCVALMDAVAKILSADVPVVEITWARFFLSRYFNDALCADECRR